MTQLLQNAAYGTALILAAAVLRRALRDRLVPEARLALWAVCLFRLLTPAAPESALSLWGLSRLFATQSQPAAPAAPTSQLYIPAAAAPAPQPEPGFSWETALLVLWLAVGAVLAVRYVLSWRRTRRAVACAIPLDSRDPRYALLPRFVRLRESPMEGAPLTFGVARPTVVLSPGLEGETLDCVLAHEGVHASRRDNLWHYVMALALVVHWWNPAVWLMSRLLRRDIELSCDRAAVQKLGAERRADYAQTLVSLATQTEGPAFCQTFGRKAAEERILSIMKFKKTSVIGVIFSLALVLAVTAAFASDPKTPTDTVVYHGQTYNRADLSQETLNWLDWYLALPEEQQLAISMVPPELITGFDSVKYFPMTLDDFQSGLARRVKDGSMTQAEADQRVADLLEFMGVESLSDISRISSDPLTIYASRDNYAFGGYSFGTNPKNFPEYVEEGEDIADMLGELLGEGHIEYDDYVLDSPNNPLIKEYYADDEDIRLAGYRFYDYDVKLPTLDEDGYSAITDEDSNPIIIGQKFYSYNIVSDGSAASGSVVRTPNGTRELCDAEDCQLSDPHYHENGHVIKVHYQDPFTDSTTAPSAIPDFGPEPSQFIYPRNSKGETYGSSAYGNPDLILAYGTKGEVGYVRDRDTLHGQYGPINTPEDAMKYMAWLETQPANYTIPLYDSEGNVIGEFAMGNPEGGKSAPAAAPTSAPAAAPAVTTYPVCAVDGCTIPGSHTHDGVNYSCNGFHSGGHCDGNCPTYSTTYPNTNSGSSGTSGHHGNGHH